MTTPAKFTKEDIDQIECRFATHSVNREDGNDFHLIKHAVRLKDGRVIPTISSKLNYERPFWVVKKGERNFNEHKEWISKDRLDEYKSTQANLVPSIARALQIFGRRHSLKDVCEQPYVFGADITSTSILKHLGNQGTEVTPYSVAVYDTETDVLHKTEEVVINTISFKDRIYTAIKASYLTGYSAPLPAIHNLINKYLGDLLKSRNATVEIEVFETEIDIIKACIKRMHEWMPDFMAVWNIEFDMDKIVEACEKAGIKPADLLSHPSVPNEFKHFKFIKGPAKKVTASGRVFSFKQSQRWHAVDVPSATCWIDAMQAYRQVRGGAAEEPSYSLDAILAKHKLPAKLKFADLDDTTAPTPNTLAWHVFMQGKYPLHYVVYNIFDCVGVELLDEATKDLQLSLPMFTGCTDFAKANSLPRKAVNALHWECLNENKVVGCTAAEMTTDDDDDTTDVSGWIVMLHPHQVTDSGLCVIEEAPDLRTNIRTHGADLDVAGAYPTNESCLNVSKETTVLELINIKDRLGNVIPEEVVRAQTINLSGGATNALEFCQVLFQMPTLTEVLDHYDAHSQGTAFVPEPTIGQKFILWLTGSKNSRPIRSW